jgi:hypothetical protein
VLRHPGLDPESAEPGGKATALHDRSGWSWEKKDRLRRDCLVTE